MIVPGFDMFRLFVQRLIKKRNPFKGDLNHLHHIIKKKFGYFVAILINCSFFITLNTLRFFFNFNTIFLLISFIIIYLFLFFIVNKANVEKKV